MQYCICKKWVYCRYRPANKKYAAGISKEFRFPKKIPHPLTPKSVRIISKISGKLQF